MPFFAGSTYYLLHNTQLIIIKLNYYAEERGRSIKFRTRDLKCTGPTARRDPAQKACVDADACFYFYRFFASFSTDE